MISGHAQHPERGRRDQAGRRRLHREAVLGHRPARLDRTRARAASPAASRMPGGASADAAAARPASKAAAPGRRQRTLARSVVIAAGQGLHSGLKTGVILHPAPAGFGIVFSSLADETAIAARLENVTDTGYNTTLSGGRPLGAHGRTSDVGAARVRHHQPADQDRRRSSRARRLGARILPADLPKPGCEEQRAAVEPIRIARTDRDRQQGRRVHSRRARRSSDHRLHAGLSAPDRRPAACTSS